MQSEGMIIGGMTMQEMEKKGTIWDASLRMEKGHALKIEAIGPFQYDWFMMV